MTLFHRFDFDRLFNGFQLTESVVKPTVSMELHTSCDSDVVLGKQQGQGNICASFSVPPVTIVALDTSNQL